MIVIIIIIIENDNNDSDNNSDDDGNNNGSGNDENNDTDDNDNNNNDYKLPVDSPHKGPIMLSFGVTFVESKNNSRASGDLRRHVPHVTSLWCDIFTQHRHICIVENGYQ